MKGFVVNVDFDIQHRRTSHRIVNRAALDEPTLRCKLEECRRQFAN